MSLIAIDPINQQIKNELIELNDRQVWTTFTYNSTTDSLATVHTLFTGTASTLYIVDIITIGISGTAYVDAFYIGDENNSPANGNGALYGKSGLTLTGQATVDIPLVISGSLKASFTRTGAGGISVYFQGRYKLATN